MRKRASALTMGLFMALALGCAGSSTGGKTGATTFRQTLGQIRKENFDKYVNQIVFVKNHYLDSGNSRSSTSALFVETEWRKRTLFPDEAALGILVVESRVTLSGRARGGPYNVSLLGENRVKYAGSAEWVKGPMTAQARAYFRDMADDLLQEFKKPY